MYKANISYGIAIGIAFSFGLVHCAGQKKSAQDFKRAGEIQHVCAQFEASVNRFFAIKNFRNPQGASVWDSRNKAAAVLREYNSLAHDHRVLAAQRLGFLLEAHLKKKEIKFKNLTGKEKEYINGFRQIEGFFREANVSCKGYAAQFKTPAQLAYEKEHPLLTFERPDLKLFMEKYPLHPAPHIDPTTQCIMQHKEQLNRLKKIMDRFAHSYATIDDLKKTKEQEEQLAIFGQEVLQLGQTMNTLVARYVLQSCISNPLDTATIPTEPDDEQPGALAKSNV